MKRKLAIYNIARAMCEDMSQKEMIQYITGETPALNTYSNNELADELQYITGSDDPITIEGSSRVVDTSKIELTVSRHEAILVMNLLAARHEPLAASIAKAVYPDTEAGHFAKYCDQRYVTELRQLSDRIEECIRQYDVVKKQQYVVDDLTDPE